MRLNSKVQVVNEDNQLKLSPANGSKEANALAGTTRALVQNMVVGVSKGFERKLELVGVGYRAKAQGRSVNMVCSFRIRSITHYLRFTADSYPRKFC